MADPIPTLPGSIPGLLRLCSPCLPADSTDTDLAPAVIVHIEGDEAWIAGDAWKEVALSAGSIPLADLVVVLSEPTGRAHAAWWANQQLDEILGALSDAEWELWSEARDLAMLGRDMTPAQIETLRRGCRLLAGLDADMVELIKEAPDAR